MWGGTVSECLRVPVDECSPVPVQYLHQQVLYLLIIIMLCQQVEYDLRPRVVLAGLDESLCCG